MEVTELGMVIEVSPMQPLKAPVPMVLIVFGIKEFLQPAIKVLDAVSIMALQLSRESYFELLCKIMFSRLLHSANTSLPI